MMPSFHEPAKEFSRQHNIKPVCLVEEAMRIGASLLAESLTKDLHSINNAFRAKHGENEVPDHGTKSGTLSGLNGVAE